MNNIQIIEENKNNKSIIIENPSPELQRFLRIWKIHQYKTLKRLKEKYCKNVIEV